MVSDSVPPAAATATATRPSTITGDSADSVADTPATVADHVEMLTVLVAVVGAGLLLDGVVATFAALFCLGVAGFLLGRVALVEWRRLALDGEN